MIAWVLLGLAALSLTFVVLGWNRLATAPGGALLVLLGAVLLPGSALLAGVSEGMHRSQELTFCLSCHEMAPYGRSLGVDDNEYLAATHVQRGLVPPDRPCYTCHADYAMFGDVKAKLNGFRHVTVHYFGTIPEKPELYQPYPNANCLHCHDGTRAFLAKSQHAKADGGFAALRAGTLSCVSSGCHDVVHGVGTLDNVEQWQPHDARAE